MLTTYVCDCIHTHTMQVPHPEINGCCSFPSFHWYLSFYCYQGRKILIFCSSSQKIRSIKTDAPQSCLLENFLSKDQKEANLIDRYMKQGCILKQIIFLLLTSLSCSMQLPSLARSLQIQGLLSNDSQEILPVTQPSREQSSMVWLGPSQVATPAEKASEIPQQEEKPQNRRQSQVKI